MSHALANSTIGELATTLRPTRRDFVVSATGGFMLQFCLPGLSRISKALGTTYPTPLNSYIQIASSGVIHVSFGGCELGQGAMSGLAQLVAEELMVDWSQVISEPALAGSLSYITGGSSAIRNNYLALREAGAAARMLLIEAGARVWGAPVAQCFARTGTVVHRPTGRSLGYGALVSAAAKLAPPKDPVLIPDADLRYIGKSVTRLDLTPKTNGRAIYGIDVTIPNMVYAVIKHCSSLGGTLASTPSHPDPGIGIVPLGNAVAIVAASTWQAMSAAEEIGVKWSIPVSSAAINSTLFDAEAATRMTKGPVVFAESIGNTTTGMAAAAHTVEATYAFPYLAHACMEVLNCTVHLTPTTCEIWAPTQAAAWVQQTAATLTGLPTRVITVHTTLLGGGLGRKIEQDYIGQAVRVAMAIKQPVKLTWPRQEDFGKDMYRPMALSRVRVGVDLHDNILAWENRIISPSILAQRGWVAAGAEDGQATEGATALAYAMNNRLVEYGAHSSPVPIGFWRSVGCSYNAFVVESFIDEVAHSLRIDPYTYRRKLLINNSRYLTVLETAASLSGWGTPLPSGHARGIAIAETFGTVVAQVAEISNITATSLRVVKVTCAVDLGRVINPDSVAAQMEGGISHGISATLWGRITFQNGVASVKNFNHYRMVRMRDMPQVTVEIISSTNPPTGAGEPGVPPIGPAIANAYFAHTGTRIRSLPFFPSQSTMGDD